MESLALSRLRIQVSMILIILGGLLLPNISLAAIIADHQAVGEFGIIPPEWITRAKAMFKLSLRPHLSWQSDCNWNADVKLGKLVL